MIRYLLLSCISLLIIPLFSSALAEDTLLSRLHKIKSPEKQVIALNNATQICWQTGHYKSGIIYGKKGLYIARKYKFKKLQGELLNNLGIIYDYKGNYPKSLECYFTALRIQEKIKDEEGQAYSMSNIGLIYTNQNNNDEALYYHTKSLKLRKKIKFSPGIAASYNNIGICYLNKKDFDRALEYFSKSKQMDVQRKDSIGLMDDLNNIGLCWLEKKQYEKAIQNFKDCIVLRLKFKDQYGASKAINNIATCYMKQKKFDEAETEFKKGLAIGLKIGGNESIWYSYENLSEIAKIKGDYKAAFNYLNKAIEIKSSWTSASSIREEAETELSYQFEKKSEIEKMRQIKKDIETQAQKKQTTLFLWSLGIIAAIIALFAFILFRRWKIATNQKRIIDEQRSLVQEKNTEIVDSINYAQRIQTAILPSDVSLKTALKHYSLFYQPKDIVAGDFYWMHQVDKTVYFAVADCTGHGVPGAFMSLLCSNALNRVILENGTVSPGELLTQARAIIVSEFAKSHMNLNDGMDISICTWNQETNSCSWAGANNPLWVLYPESEEMHEIKGDKQPVGNHYHHLTDFTTHDVQLKDGARLYLFTDGIADQFGEESGKKFKSKRLKELLLSSRKESIHEQMLLVKDNINDWKGNLEQIDDVCLLIVGV
jgi:serine phosphatase RsbU (regulator of sigma subunit)/tetratricopeptide (TPR) repeat protein